MDNTAITLAYQHLTFNYPQAAAELYRAAGTADELYACRKDVRQIIPDASENLCSLLSNDWDSTLRWAEEEMEWCEKKHITILTLGSADYPQRLVNCFDAPIVLYSMGNGNLNAAHTVSIVGTRQCTQYGKDMVDKIVAELKAQVPDLLVVSGLAYGIDVCSHKAALKNGIDTVGVLAHGLDTMYPASHRDIAIRMLQHGGLLTEYHSKTRGDRQNFLRRNRIVAGIGDCTIVAESMQHGGSLVTARIANDYNNEVFAIPGRVGDATSEGCNDLIKANKAHMLTSAQDIIDTLGWQTIAASDAARRQGIQMQMFPELTPDEQLIVDVLQKEDKQQNIICAMTGIPVHKVSVALFQLEMKGIVKALAGSVYHLIVR